MCECGCGSVPASEVYRIGKSRVTIGIRIFPGCRDCDYGPGIEVGVFDSPKSEFLDGPKPGVVKPDEYGGSTLPDGRYSPISVGLIDPRDLREAAKDMVEEYGEPGEDMTFAEWIEEAGVELLRTAVYKRMERTSPVPPPSGGTGEKE